jgi:hypothetical protein
MAGSERTIGQQSATSGRSYHQGHCAEAESHVPCELSSGPMKKSPILEFESSAFAPLPGEDEATNPGVFGKALAQWLGNQLRRAGVATGEVIAEDFGWVIPVKNGPYFLRVACSSGEKPNGWKAFAFAEGGLIPRLFRKNKSGAALYFLHASVRRSLEAESSVHGLREQA